MKMNTFTIQEMYLTASKYVFFRNLCIFAEDIIESGQINLLFCDDIHSHSYFFYICQHEYAFCDETINQLLISPYLSLTF